MKLSALFILAIFQLLISTAAVAGCQTTVTCSGGTASCSEQATVWHINPDLCGGEECRRVGVCGMENPDIHFCKASYIDAANVVLATEGVVYACCNSNGDAITTVSRADCR